MQLITLDKAEMKKKKSKLQHDRGYNENKIYFSLMEKSGGVWSKVGIGAWFYQVLSKSLYHP